MCLAIAYKDSSQRGMLARLWWKIAVSPLRLFLFSTLFHLAFLLLLLTLDTVSIQVLTDSSSLIILIIGLAGGPVLGLLFEKLPNLLMASMIDYNVFGTSYNLTFIGLLLLEISWFSSSALSIVATGLVLLAWLVSVRAFYWTQHWAKQGTAWLISSMMWNLYAIAGIQVLLLLAQLTKQLSVFPLLLALSLVFLTLLLLQILLLYLRQK